MESDNCNQRPELSSNVSLTPKLTVTNGPVRAGDKPFGFVGVSTGIRGWSRQSRGSNFQFDPEQYLNCASVLFVFAVNRLSRLVPSGELVIVWRNADLQVPGRQQTAIRVSLFPRTCVSFSKIFSFLCCFLLDAIDNFATTGSRMSATISTWFYPASLLRSRLSSCVKCIVFHCRGRQFSRKGCHVIAHNLLFKAKLIGMNFDKRKKN